MINIRGLSVERDDGILLSDIDLGIVRGGHLFITGPCGSGKTTLAKVLAGKVWYNQGQVKYDNPWGQNIFDHIRLVTFTDQSKLFRGANAQHYYQQRFNSWDSDGHLTVREYIESEGKDIDGLAFSRILTQLNLGKLLDTERIKLSSGQHRKMFIAKALLQKPHILLLDNLYVGLDEKSVDMVNHFLDHLVSSHDVTVIIFDHHRTLPIAVEREIRLQDGRIVYDGRVDKQKQTSPKIGVKKQDSLRRWMKSKAMPRYTGKVVSMENVSIAYAGTVLMDKLCWTINKGEKWVLSGSNGSGKSLVAGVIYGDVPQAYASRVTIFGSPLRPGRSIWEIKRDIGYTSPELHTYLRGDMLFEEVVETGRHDILSLPANRVGKSPATNWFMAYFELSHLSGRRWTTLSSGEQRLCLFIRALIKNPPLLVLDEPFQCIDRGRIDLAKHLLAHMTHDQQTIILIAHREDHIPETFGLIKKLN